MADCLNYSRAMQSQDLGAKMVVGEGGVEEKLGGHISPPPASTLQYNTENSQGCDILYLCIHSSLSNSINYCRIDLQGSGNNVKTKHCMSVNGHVIHHGLVMF